MCAYGTLSILEYIFKSEKQHFSVTQVFGNVLFVSSVSQKKFKYGIMFANYSYSRRFPRFFFFVFVFNMIPTADFERPWEGLFYSSLTRSSKQLRLFYMIYVKYIKYIPEINGFLTTNEAHPKVLLMRGVIVAVLLVEVNSYELSLI